MTELPLPASPPSASPGSPAPRSRADAAPTTGYARRLGLFSGTMLVIGGIVGSGIFLNPSVVAQRTGSAGLTMTVWALGAAVALVGAFVFAELGGRRPEAGGGYAYLRDAFGPLPAFLYGWALLLMIATGATAAVAVTFASYTASLASRGGDGRLTTTLAVGAIVFLSVVNALGVRAGALTQNVFTLLKLAAIAALVVVGLALPPPPAAVAAATCAGCAPLTLPAGTLGVALAVGTALVPVLFAYGGWQQTNFVAEEIVEPERNLPRALVLGVIVVVLAYVLVNGAYLRALGVQGLAHSAAPAADTMSVYFGTPGRLLITLGIAISTFGFLSGVILVSPRVYQAMARDGLFFRSFARLHPRYRTPVAAIVCQGVWAIVLVFSGSYGQLLDYVVFADWIFFGAAAATLFVFRRRDAALPPGAPGGVAARLPLYPWSLLFFLAAAGYVVAGSIASNPGNALRGTLLLALGVPVFAYWRRRGGR